VTYTNRKAETGYIEICKFVYTASAQGNYTFTVAGTTVTVAANSCSPPIQVPSGPVVINEAPMGGNVIINVGTWPAGRQLGWTPSSSTVMVPPGGIANETVAGIANGPKGAGRPAPAERSAIPPWVSEAR
jgi:hypothetical protein